MNDSTIGAISELKVMRSAAGFYVGHTYYDTEMRGDFPWSRESEYFPTEEDASAYLEYTRDH